MSPLPPTPRSTRPARLAALLCAGWLAACSSAGPDYRRPELGLPASVRPGADALDPGAAAPAASTATAPAPPAKPGAWWQAFGSADLDALIERSLREHPGVAAGQAALRQAEAFVRAQQGLYAPQLQAVYAGSRQRTANVLASPLSDASYVFTLHTVQLDLSYTPDVFGANRRAVEGLQAGVEQQQALLEATRLALAA
ncbi:MAG: TolC family protein, partial [Pseudomonadota bacterium]|nr:TolC family protein [Pseudomonadota bacterium]